MRIASIDIGTNTFRILIGEVKGQRLKKLYVGNIITRLGGGFSEGTISEEAIIRTIPTLIRFSGLLEEYRVNRVRAVATSVVRKASNKFDFLKRVKSETGIGVEVISWEEEARLTALGVLSSVEVPTKYGLILDIGGGSTEYTLVKGSKILRLESTGLGVVHLTEKYLIDDPPSESDIKLLSLEVEKVISDELTWISFEEPITLIATAGTPTTLAAMELELKQYDPGLVNRFILKKYAILNILKKLLRLTAEERLKIPGLQKGREDLILSGIVILIKTMEKFSKEEVLVSDGGLLEGVAFGLIEG